MPQLSYFYAPFFFPKIAAAAHSAKRSEPTVI